MSWTRVDHVVVAAVEVIRSALKLHLGSELLPLLMAS